jgi:hypothetical protein
MFQSLPVKKLRKLISDYKKEHNVIGSVGKLKKAQLVDKLGEHFILENDKLVLKQHNKGNSVKNNNNISNVDNNNGMTTGQKTLMDAVNAIENKAVAKERYKKDKKMADRIRGTN